jgi:hypothetical protein
MWPRIHLAFPLDPMTDSGDQNRSDAFKSVMVAPLETDRPNAFRALLTGSVLAVFGIAIVLVTFIIDLSSSQYDDLVGPTQGDGPIGLNLICPAQILLLSLVPVILGCVGTRRRRRTIHPRTLLPSHMECLRRIRWPIRRLVISTSVAAPAQELASHGIRVVADVSLLSWVQTRDVPQGLLEPMSLQAARPVGGCQTAFNIFMLSICFLFLVPSLYFLFFGVPQPGIWPVVTLSMLVLFFVALVRTIIQLPSLQRCLVDVPILSGWARGGWRPIYAVAGPGWVRHGSHVWQAERDILLIRRRGRHAPGTSLEVMLVGQEGRLRFVLAGCDDSMLERLWSAWMSPDVRPELA